MLEAWLGGCNVVIAKPDKVNARSATAILAASETEREVEQPLLDSSNHQNHVEELDSNVADSERCVRPAGRSFSEFEALATAPVELMAELPDNYKPGAAIMMHGPHGPVQVVPPQGLEPGAPVRFRLAPQPEFRIRVPSGCGPGSIIRITRKDGAEVAVPVPPNHQAGDVFEVTPPCMMVRVPEGAQAGDGVVFRHSLGPGPNGCEATEWCRSEVPKGARPGSYFAARLPRPERQETRKEAPLPFRRKHMMEGGPCTLPTRFLEEDTEEC